MFLEEGRWQYFPQSRQAVGYASLMLLSAGGSLILCTILCLNAQKGKLQTFAGAISPRVALMSYCLYLHLKIFWKCWMYSQGVSDSLQKVFTCLTEHAGPGVYGPPRMMLAWKVLNSFLLQIWVQKIFCWVHACTEVSSESHICCWNLRLGNRTHQRHLWAAEDVEQYSVCRGELYTNYNLDSH